VLFQLFRAQGIPSIVFVTHLLQFSCISWQVILAGKTKQNKSTPAKSTVQKQKQKTPGSHKGAGAMKPTMAGGVGKKQNNRASNKPVPMMGVEGGASNRKNNVQKSNQRGDGHITIQGRGGKGQPAFRKRHTRTPDLLGASRQPLGQRFEKLRRGQPNVNAQTHGDNSNPHKRNAHGLIMPY